MYFLLRQDGVGQCREWSGAIADDFSHMKAGSTTTDKHRTFPTRAQGALRGQRGLVKLGSGQWQALGLGLCWHLAGTWSIFPDYVNDKQMAICTRFTGFVLFSSLVSL